MSLSYSYACSQIVKGPTCFVCFSMLDPANCTDPVDPLQVVSLPQCKHVVHSGCFDHWSTHSKELAKRDVSVVDQATCPVCKVSIDKKEGFHHMRSQDIPSSYKKDHNQTPDPELPPPVLEMPGPDSQYDAQSIQVIFDKAVSVEHSEYLFNVSNFPALHQMKNRYGITLSAGQLDKILNEALLKKLPERQSVTIDVFSVNKIKMAMLLRSDDEASKEVVHKFFTRILNLPGFYSKNVVIDFLLGQVILDKKVLQEGFDYFIKKNFFREAEEIYKKHDLRIEYEALKKVLMRIRSEYNVSFLARMAPDSDHDFQQVVRDVLKELNESTVTFQGYSFECIRETIMALMRTVGTGCLDQTETNKSLRLAVLSNDICWQYQLHHEYGAVLESQFFKEYLESTDASKLIRKIDALFKIKANDDVTNTALIAALMRVVAKSNRSSSCFEIKKLLTKCLKAGVWSQQLVNNALLRAIDADEYLWAQTLNKDFHAVLDAETLKDYLWKTVTKYPSTTNCYVEQRFVWRVKSLLDFAGKNSEQNNDAISFVLNRLRDNPSLSQKPLIQKCVKLMVEFNSHSVSSPEAKRQKIS